MKILILRLSVVMGLAVMFCSSVSGGIIENSIKQKSNSTLDMIVLLPGDSRSIEFEYNNTFLGRDSYHVALVAAVLPDYEIHQLTINLTPVGDVGSEIAYFTWGAFVSLTGVANNFFDSLEPKFTYGFKSVSYTVSVNPLISLGLLFSAAMVEFSHFNFPLNMTMTLTLSN